jgi:hypothetical protein
VSGPVGSLAWARRTQGALGPADRIRLLGQGIAGQLPQILATFAGRLGIRPRTRTTVDADLFVAPDSKAAREAEELCGEQRPEILINHCYRTYLWATALAHYDDLAFDREILYVSSLLHDLGLSERGLDVPPTCFTLIGAETAAALGQHGVWGAERAERAAEAITMHMNLRVRPDAGAEPYLLTAGTQLDVLGHRLWQIAPETAVQVLERYPRHGVKRSMLKLFGEQARAHPRSRARFYRYLGQSMLFRTAPFAE